MRPRDPDEDGRSASPLELFFDLVFVIAVSIAAVNLHHAMSEAHFWHGITSYLVVFFAIWWAWMNFTWFATSFDTDDWLYRVVTVVQMAGVLTLAAGIGDAFARDDFTIMIAGYVVMRVAMVAQWLRASRGAGDARRTTQIYAWGIAALQVLWLAWLAVPDGAARTATLLALIAAELAIPVVAERRNQTPWHPHHITERYGLFTIIVLGESLLASANAIITAREDETEIGELVPLAVLALVVTAGLWWIYFWAPHHERIGRLRQSLRYGYGHYVIFAAAGALSAGIEVEIDVLTSHSEVSDVVASLCVAVPVALFLAAVWWIIIRPHANRLVNTVMPVGTLVVLVDPVLPFPIALTSVVVAAIVVVLVLNPPRSREPETAEA
jgi:low temperature requirement protein LtrA